ncbi:MAG TPA: thioredoxin-dependent thiol peroxidase, partial [Phycisphaerales bacterium]|nr:thioredoxin-dependent thiol peroxidase [Phycisphaerales bacterium]
RLSQYAGQWVVLYFYPKDNTSGCTKQACAFRDQQPDFGKLDAVVLGVSPDDEKAHTKFVDKQNLNFTLLADPDHVALEKYGVWQEKSMYGRKYMGVVRTTYLIDPKGKIAHRWDKVKVANHIPDVLGILEQLQNA